MAESGRLDLENIAQYCISHGIRDPAIIARRMVVKGEDMEMPVTMDQAVAAARKAVGATAAAAGTWRDEDHPRGQPANSGQFVKKKQPNTPCLLYTSPSPRDRQKSRMPSSA